MAITQNNAQSPIEHYLKLPWTFTIEQEKDEEFGKLYIVRVKELPGVVTDAPTVETAMESIKEAMLLAFEVYRKAGEEIPEPLTEK